jgi:hypothetical protein
MASIANAAAAGLCGAITTNALHELTRHTIPNAPRVDVLGMQALAKMLDSMGAEPPKGRSLYNATLAADVVSNGAYFAGVAVGPRPVLTGLLLGLAGGIGAVVLPQPLGLAAEPTSRTAFTAVLTTLLYTAGGVAAGLVYERLRD